MAASSHVPRLTDILEAIEHIRAEMAGVSIDPFEADWRSPFEGWFAALARLGQGNLSNVKGVGEGVLEYGSISGRGTGCISAATARRR
jgi:hypothetical protein